MNNSVLVNPSKSNMLFAFLVGFLSANNIIYLFRIGNTTIKAITLVALFGLVNIAITNHGKIKNPLQMMPQSLRYSFWCVLLSFVPVVLFNRDILYQWFVGIIAMLLMAMVAALVILLYKDCKEYIYKGIFFGMILNAILILWGLYNHTRGVSFTLAEFFPYESIAPVYLRGSYRGSGLFREAGHLMRFASVLGFPLVLYYKDNKRKMFVSMVSMIIILAYTRSSTAVVVGLELAILTLAFSGKDIKSFWRVLAIIAAALIAAIVIPPVRNFVTNEIFSGFVDFTTYREQTTRLTGMRSALRVAAQYPIIGSGWNTLSMIFQKNGYNVYISNGFGGGEYVSAAFSEGLTLLAELGLFSLFYYWFVLKSGISLIRSKDKLSISIGVSLVGYFVLLFITDFSFNLNGCAAVLIGIAVGHLRENQENTETIDKEPIDNHV